MFSACGKDMFSNREMFGRKGSNKGKLCELC